MDRAIELSDGGMQDGQSDRVKQRRNLKLTELHFIGEEFMDGWTREQIKMKKEQ